MIKITSNELRNLWIEYFRKHNHLFLLPRSLLPDNDPSLLFINSGVATLKHYFSGQIEPPAKNLVNVQKVIRTNDIENVGMTSRHHTFFEMLGNFSIGGYFKEKAIEFGYDFLVNVLKMDVNRLYITVYEKDLEVKNLWIKNGIDSSHIFLCNKKRNFWDVGMGPCGPCTEIFYDRLEKFDPKKQGLKLLYDDLENDRYIEVWNIVFSEYNNDGQNNYTPLLQKNIDTGAGLERLLCISQDVPTNFDSDLFLDIIREIEQFSDFKYCVKNYFIKNDNQHKINYIYRIIADHLRAIVLALSDGAIFDNKGQGYILRKLLRRIAGLGKIINLNQNYFLAGILAVIKSLGNYYTNLKPQKNYIINLMEHEYHAFLKTLDHAWIILNQLIINANNSTLNSYDVFKLVETYGFPKELLDEILHQKQYKYDHQSYSNYFNQHQQISKKLRNIVVMEKQNNSLLNFHKSSKFDYTKEIINTKIIGLFDINWNPIKRLNFQNGYVILKQTSVYAFSGGQESDYGWINDFFVSDVIKCVNNQNVHFVNNANLQLDQKVVVKHDKNRRQQLSRQHSSEHLLHAALKHLLNKNVKQEGAFKSEEKITLDFRYHLKPTQEQLNSFENFVKNKINESHNVITEMVTLEEAKKRGASAYFEDTYKKQTGLLRLVTISALSVELCGGTHIKNTKEIEDFLIFNMESKGAGAWRIEAVSGYNAILTFLKNENNKLNEKMNQYLEELKNIFIDSKIIDQWKNKFKTQLTRQNWLENKKLLNLLQAFVIEQNNQFHQNKKLNLTNEIKSKCLNQKPLNKIITLNLNEQEPKMINSIINSFFNELNNYLVVIFNKKNNIHQYYLLASRSFWVQINSSANDCVKEINNLMQGKGGGRFEVAQGSYANKFNSEDLIDFLKKKIN